MNKPGATLKRGNAVFGQHLRFALCLAYPVIVAVGVQRGGVAGWASFLLGGSLYPLLDALPLTVTDRTPVRRVRRAAPEHVFLLTYAVAEALLLCWTLWLVANRGYQAWELVGIGLSLGTMTGGIGIPAAHELIHSKNRLFRATGVALLAPVLYMHFRVEHIFGHHRWVATPHDPATARRGESLWSFVVRSISGQFLSAYRIEARRTKQERRAQANRVLVYLLVEASLVLAVLCILGPSALAVFMLQAATAVLFLEATNYIEHYGLERRRLPDGRYEPVSAKHSWNTSSLFTNSLAFNLGLHSDHHAAAGKSFIDLRHREEAPQLPAGYLTMLSIAAVPPLWRRLMDPRVHDFRERHDGNRARGGVDHSREQETNDAGRA